MTIALGAEAIGWHARVQAGEITLAEVIDEAAEAGAEYLQVSIGYVEELDGGAPRAVERAAAREIFLRATGRPIGRRYWDADPGRAAAAIAGWLGEAAAIGSESLMLYSGVYRPELAGDPALVAAELAYLGEVLAGAEPAARELGVRILLENASDFSAEELLSLIDPIESEAIGVFLDITNVYNVWDDPAAAIARLGARAGAGHVKDFVLESLWAESGHHRNGYAVRFRYPGEGVTPVADLVGWLADAVGERDFCLAVEGLHSEPGVADQVERLGASLALLRATLGER